MAFSEAQKVKLRSYLGYPDTFRQNNTRLESAFDVIGGRADTQAEAELVLSEIATLETKITASYSLAGLKRAEDIEWYNSAQGSIVVTQRKYGRRLCNRLSIIFGVPLANDYFGESGYGGDGWSSVQNQYGGIIPLG